MYTPPPFTWKPRRPFLFTRTEQTPMPWNLWAKMRRNNSDSLGVLLNGSQSGLAESWATLD